MSPARRDAVHRARVTPPSMTCPGGAGSTHEVDTIPALLEETADDLSVMDAVREAVIAAPHRTPGRLPLPARRRQSHPRHLPSRPRNVGQQSRFGRRPHRLSRRRTTRALRRLQRRDAPRETERPVTSRPATPSDGPYRRQSLDRARTRHGRPVGYRVRRSATPSGAPDARFQIRAGRSTHRG